MGERHEYQLHTDALRCLGLFAFVLNDVTIIMTPH